MSWNVDEIRRGLESARRVIQDMVNDPHLGFPPEAGRRVMEDFHGNFERRVRNVRFMVLAHPQNNGEIIARSENLDERRVVRRDPLTSTEAFVNQFRFPSCNYNENRTLLDVNVRVTSGTKCKKCFQIYMRIISYIPVIGLLCMLCCGTCMVLKNRMITYESKREGIAAKARFYIFLSGFGFLLLIPDIIGTVIREIQKLNLRKIAKQKNIPSIDPSIIM